MSSGATYQQDTLDDARQQGPTRLTVGREKSSSLSARKVHGISQARRTRRQLHTFYRKRVAPISSKHSPGGGWFVLRALNVVEPEQQQEMPDNSRLVVILHRKRLGARTGVGRWPRLRGAFHQR